MPGTKIKIDRTHIAKAIKGDASHCMIAESIRDKFPKARWILVDMQTIRWTNRDEGTRYIYLTPRTAQLALLRFDRGEPVPPFSLFLESPIVKAIHPLTRRATKKPTKAKAKVNTRRYKHKKAAPEATAVRRYGLRNIEV